MPAPPVRLHPPRSQTLGNPSRGSFFRACAWVSLLAIPVGAQTVAPGSYELNRLRSGDPLIIVDGDGLAHPSVFRGQSSDSLFASPESFAAADIREIRLLPWHSARRHPRAEKGGPEWLFLDRRADLWVGGWTSLTVGGGAAIGAALGSLAVGALTGGIGGFVLMALFFR